MQNLMVEYYIWDTYKIIWLTNVLSLHLFTGDEEFSDRFIFNKSYIRSYTAKLFD